MSRRGLALKGSALLMAGVLALAPVSALARAGGGGSFGSRGGYTFTAPPSTATAPSVAPIQRSYTPPSSPSYGNPGYGAPAYAGGGYGGRSPFVSGLMGGLIGAGLGGMLFGHGMFGGIDGIGGLFGFLLQIFLIVMVGRWLFRMLFRQPALAGGGLFQRTGGMGAAPRPMMGGAAPQGRPIAIAPSDYQAFEALLQQVQAAWSQHDLATLRAVATPEMVSYFAEQLAEQSSRGVRNLVSAVRLESGDLAQAWTEQGREYATVAMRFSMIDVTVDPTGRVVDGSANERTLATEVWTFVRVPGGRWLLSAIQQTR